MARAGGKGCLHACGNVRGIAGAMRGRIWLAFCSLGTRYPLPLLQDTPGCHKPKRSLGSVTPLDPRPYKAMKHRVATHV
jgi:hypothetical protein